MGPSVAQGCRQVGEHTYTVVRSKGQLVLEVEDEAGAGSSPLQALQETVAALSPEEQQLVQRSITAALARESLKVRRCPSRRRPPWVSVCADSGWVALTRQRCGPPPPPRRVDVLPFCLPAPLPRRHPACVIITNPDPFIFIHSAAPLVATLVHLIAPVAGSGVRPIAALVDRAGPLHRLSHTDTCSIAGTARCHHTG